MKSKIMMILGFALLIGLLLGAYLFFGKDRVNGDGTVKMVAIQTKEDADSTLLCCEGAAVLIDTGEEQDAEHILEVLVQSGVEKLDCLILSHSDADHIGGALKILNEIPVGQVVESPYEETTEAMLEINAYLKQEKIPIIYPAHTWHCTAGAMQLLVYPPLEKHYNDDNNYSLAVLVQHQEVNFLFAGDALRKRSEELLLIDWPQIALYKVPHHGRKNSASKDLFDKVHPQYGVVTSQKADSDILRAAEENDTKLLFTGDGDICLVSDGRQLSIWK